MKLILNPIADELELVIRNFDSIESGKNLNHYDFYYESVVGDRVINAIPPYVKLETSLMSYAFPTEEKELGNYILDALGTEEEELITIYDLRTFPMRVQSLNRTLIDNCKRGACTQNYYGKRNCSGSTSGCKYYRVGSKDL